MRGPVRLGDILEKVVTSCGQDQSAREKLKQGFKENRIFAVWEDAVGQTMALHARPERIQRGQLIVFVSDSAWLQELQFLKTDIKKKLNKRLGRGTVRDIRFQIGKISKSVNLEKYSDAAVKERSSGLSIIDSRILSEIDRQVQCIKDPGVRESVKRYLIASSTSPVDRKGKL
jgi:hypothetical protein